MAQDKRVMDNVRQSGGRATQGYPAAGNMTVGWGKRTCNKDVFLILISYVYIVLLLTNMASIINIVHNTKSHKKQHSR